MPKDTRPPLVFEQYFCDNCGNETRGLEFDRMSQEYDVSDEGVPITELQIDIDSANKGESAVLCPECFAWYKGEIDE